MKCTKCGATIPDDKLYCENCGEEVNIVPLFEPEVETQLDENLHKISHEVMEDVSVKNHGKKKRKKHYLSFVLILAFFSLIAGIIGLKYLFDSPEYHSNKGNSYLYAEEYKKAVSCYEKALSKNPENTIEIYLYLVKCYEKLGYDGKYEEYLHRVIESEQANEVQQITAYSKLIDLYQAGNSYQTINNLLKECDNEKVVTRFRQYMVSAPTFSYEEGNYQEIIPLKINSADGDKIYYTLDGSDPTIESQMYTEPIFMDDGIYRFRAVCIDEHGVKSDVVEKIYEVNFANK